MGKYTKQDWENAGLLHGFTEERKDYIVELLNNVVHFLSEISFTSFSITRKSDGMKLDADDLMRVETVIFPIIIRTLSEVDLTIDDIKNMYNHLIFDYAEKFTRDFSEHISAIDFEAEYMCTYSDNLIKLIQSKS